MMLSGNGTIDYDAEIPTLDAHKTSAARKDSTTKTYKYRLSTEFLKTCLPNPFKNRIL